MSGVRRFEPLLPACGGEGAGVGLAEAARGLAADAGRALLAGLARLVERDFGVVAMP
jgi:hypothetical protein